MEEGREEELDPPKDPEKLATAWCKTSRRAEWRKLSSEEKVAIGTAALMLGGEKDMERVWGWWDEMGGRDKEFWGKVGKVQIEEGYKE